MDETGRLQAGLAPPAVHFASDSACMEGGEESQSQSISAMEPRPAMYSSL